MIVAVVGDVTCWEIKVTPVTPLIVKVVVPDVQGVPVPVKYIIIFDECPLGTVDGEGDIELIAVHVIVDVALVLASVIVAVPLLARVLNTNIADVSEFTVIDDTDAFTSPDVTNRVDAVSCVQSVFTPVTLIEFVELL